MTAPFEWVSPTSGKVRCPVCLRTGWGPINPTYSTASPWQRSCLDGHPHSCACGRRFATAQQVATHARKSSEPGPHGLVRDSAS